MAGFRFYTRRLRALISAATIQVILILFLILLLVRFVLHNNHDPEPLPPMPGPITTVDDPAIDWFKFAYVQYVTSPEYLCSALMLWSQVETIGSRAQRLMLYPSHWILEETDDTLPSKPLTPIARLLKQVQTDYYVKLQPVEVLHQNHTDRAIWSDSYTKLLAFNLTHNLFQQVESAVQHVGPNEYDMDILNALFAPHILAMPPRPYHLLSSEFRRKSHKEYLGDAKELWDPGEILAEAKYMHFSDWPIPKPWIRATKEELNKYMPECGENEWFGATDCRDRTIWLGLYGMFARRRKEVCGVGFELQQRVLIGDKGFKGLKGEVGVEGLV
ncbi:hypothetical protein SS1G_07199 [Sclerotinia sclerotiorum 1980 UF-70]|uniref:Glucose N-acetyltransferase 1 n=1 Tax=Sclerotinia sclerotiorum (strain ATCC 18683 / 1980 / Ss-1) TaxID=665079 RepID=A7EPF0_SCLS1|nr:hypothetical protein SS1G_07199 [Sclerotinia sclerotiorum 1980 UF-70]EDO04716.1 hypothetical protein SS1G_07199 [Sclerotinia sclerotiorum 1980 UF-70]